MNPVITSDSIEDLVLHRAPMLLVQSMIAWDEAGAEVLVDTSDSILFADSEGNIPAWVGIEYMAQAIAVYAGMVSKLNNEPLKLGFLLGTRRYSANVPTFLPNQQLRVQVKELLRDETNLVLFDCYIFSGDELLARAELKAIQPPNLDNILAQFKK